VQSPDCGEIVQGSAQGDLREPEVRKRRGHRTPGPGSSRRTCRHLQGKTAASLGSNTVQCGPSPQVTAGSDNPYCQTQESGETSVGLQRSRRCTMQRRCCGSDRSGRPSTPRSSGPRGYRRSGDNVSLSALSRPNRGFESRWSHHPTPVVRCDSWTCEASRTKRIAGRQGRRRSVPAVHKAPRRFEPATRLRAGWARGLLKMCVKKGWKRRPCRSSTSSLE
jgi:hypothetical protein